MQAVEAEEKEDREIICSEVFSDITCELDAHAKGDTIGPRAATGIQPWHGVGDRVC